MSQKNYYETLGVEQDSTPEEIKKAFKKKSKETHPDKDGGSSEDFKEVNEAYRILGNPKTRLRYDAGDNRLEEDFVMLFSQYIQRNLLNVVMLADDITNKDILNQFIKETKHHVTQCEARIRELKQERKKLVKLEDFISRTKNKEGKESFLISQFKHIHKDIELRIKSNELEVEEKLQFYLKVIVELKNHTYDFKERMMLSSITDEEIVEYLRKGY